MAQCDTLGRSQPKNPVLYAAALCRAEGVGTGFCGSEAKPGRGLCFRQGLEYGNMEK